MITDYKNRMSLFTYLKTGTSLSIQRSSLVHWERYVNCESEAEKAEHLKQQIRAIHDHVTTLSAKDYPDLAQLHCLDFVLMFMPI